MPELAESSIGAAALERTLTTAEPEPEMLAPSAAPPLAETGDAPADPADEVNGPSQRRLAFRWGMLLYPLVLVLGAGLGAAAGLRLKPPPLVETRSLNFDPETTPAEALVTGWASWETTPTGDTFCWCEGQSCRVAVQSRADGDRRVRVRAWPFRWEKAPPQSMKVFLNDAELGTRQMSDGPGVVSFNAPAAAWRPGRNELRFDLAYAEAPKDRILGSADARKLSASFDWVEILGP